MKIDLTNVNYLSGVNQRKLGISKRAHCRFTTEDNKREQENREELRMNSSRVPGKIYKNTGPKLKHYDISYILSLNSKNG